MNFEIQIKWINFSVLYIAVYYGHFKSVEALLQRGADLNVEDKEGKTALDYGEYNNFKRNFSLIQIDFSWKTLGRI